MNIRNGESQTILLGAIESQSGVFIILHGDRLALSRYCRGIIIVYRVSAVCKVVEGKSTGIKLCRHGCWLAPSGSTETVTSCGYIS